MDREIIRRRHLPHWDVPGAPYFVTSCLHGSIPARGLLEIAQFRKELSRRPKPTALSMAEWKVQCWKKTFLHVERYLDQSPARRDLADRRLAKIVVDSIFHFAGERYELLSYVVMPSHLHWLFRPLPDWVASLPEDDRTPRQRIVYSVNRFTATRCNRVLGVTGPFWQKEPYDHWVRDVDELERIIRYIEENPVKAGLVDTAERWPFSSAWARKMMGAEWGMPLLKSLSRSES